MTRGGGRFGVQRLAVQSWPEGRRPKAKGLDSAAQGFNPGDPQNKWFALKGRQDTTDEFRIHRSPNESGQLPGATIGIHFRIVSQFDLALIQGASLGLPVPGVKTLG